MRTTHNFTQPDGSRARTPAGANYSNTLLWSLIGGTSNVSAGAADGRARVVLTTMCSYECDAACNGTKVNTITCWFYPKLPQPRTTHIT